MEALLSAVEEHKIGVIILVVSIAILLYVLRRFLQAFGVGRKSRKVIEARIQFQAVISQVIMKIIDQFRHFLAALVVVIFAILTITMVLVIDNDRLGALQLIISAFTGLLGTVLGFYFGEKSKTPVSSFEEVITDEDLEQGDTEESEPIIPFEL